MSFPAGAEPGPAAGRTLGRARRVSWAVLAVVSWAGLAVVSWAGLAVVSWCDKQVRQ